MKTVIDGVTISWRDTRQMVQTEPDDVEMLGSFRVTLSATNATVAAMANALLDAQILETVAEFDDMFCPHSDSRLRTEGLDNVGDVIIRIYRGDRKCDAVSSRDMAHFDPARFSNGGEAAMKSIAWMRDIGVAIQEYRSALIRHDGSHVPAKDAIAEAVNGHAFAA